MELLRETIKQQARQLRENQERIDRLVEAVARKDGGVSVQMPRVRLPEFDDKPAPEKGEGWFDRKVNPLPPGGNKPQ